MGQSIVVTEKPSVANRGVVRFETNRLLTGMGHERYVAGEEIFGQRPPDEIARRLFATDAVAGVQVNGNMITVNLRRGYDSSGMAEIIENLYRYYPDVDESASAEEPSAEEPGVEAPGADA